MRAFKRYFYRLIFLIFIKQTNPVKQLIYQVSFWYMTFNLRYFVGVHFLRSVRLLLLDRREVSCWQLNLITLAKLISVIIALVLARSLQSRAHLANRIY